MLNLIFGSILIGLGLFNITLGLKPDMSQYVLKSEVVKSMSGDWFLNSFNCQNTEMKDNKGNTLFIPASEVQERVDKLNKVLTK